MRYLSILAVMGIAGLVLAGRPTAVQAQGWGTVKGQAVFGGDKIPDAKELNVDKDQAHCLSKGKIFNEEWVINPKNKGIRWTFVWLAPDPDSDQKTLPIHPDLKEIKEKTVTMDQPCCAFVPHALAMRQGQELIAKNPSPIAHNFKYGGSEAINPGGNPQIPPNNSFAIKNLLADRLPITVNCTQHGWMKAWIRVFDHPYYAVTNEDGAFEIKNAPAGKYRLVAWHEGVGYNKVETREVDGKKLRIFGTPITIKADGTTEETISLKP